MNWLTTLVFFSISAFTIAWIGIGISGKPPGDPIFSTPSALRAIQKFCSRQLNGEYSYGCSMFRIECTGGTAQMINCPDDEAWDEKKNSCQKRHTVPACTSSIRQKEIHVDCEFANDGKYDLLGCDHHFIECVKGRAYTRQCRNKLVFNGKAGKCDSEANTEDCKKRICGADEPNWFFSGCRGRTRLTSNDQPLQNVYSPVKKLSCSLKRHGFYPVRDCSRYYYECSDRGIIIHLCPDDLFYSQKKNDCVRKESIGGCNGVESKGIYNPPNGEVSQYYRVEPFWG